MIEGFGIAQLIDAVIVITLIECLGLIIHHRATGRGVAPRDFFANMVAGLSLMLALHCLATRASTAWVALFLAAAGGAHGIDIVMRWRFARRARLGKRLPELRVLAGGASERSAKAGRGR